MAPPGPVDGGAVSTTDAFGAVGGTSEIAVAGDVAGTVDRTGSVEVEALVVSVIGAVVVTSCTMVGSGACAFDDRASTCAATTSVATSAHAARVRTRVVEVMAK